MKIFRWILASFSLYSRIPVPQIGLKDEDMAHALMFLPLVGVILGICVFGAEYFLSVAGAPVFVRAVLSVLIPIVITGGFHIDGFLDTEDALRSYQPRERKLEIMKDPHVGSFAVTGLIKILAAAFCGAGIIVSESSGNGFPGEGFMAACGIFVISRSVCALTSLGIKKAKKDGMLVRETGIRERYMKAAIILQGLAAAIYMVYINWMLATFALGIFAIYTLVYINRSLKEFGGVTGDTAGYYVVVSEVIAVDMLAAAMLLLKVFKWA